MVRLFHIFCRFFIIIEEVKKETGRTEAGSMMKRKPTKKKKKNLSEELKEGFVYLLRVFLKMHELAI